MKKDRIINKFLERQNDTVDNSQKNLYTKEDYERLLNVVIDVLKKNKHADISEIREELYKRSGLEAKLRHFFLTQKRAPGGIISFGTDKHQEKIIFGHRQEVTYDHNDCIYDEEDMNNSTLFDLGSCTKLFTSIAILQLASNGQLSISDKVGYFTHDFKNIGDLSIYDLLIYAPLVTEKRIDESKDFNSAQDVLFNVRSKTYEEAFGKERYNDISSMVLKYIVEKESGMDFENYVKVNILGPLKMDNTFVNIPQDLVTNTANTNYSMHFTYDGTLQTDMFHPKGISSDKKAIIMGQPEGKLSGHAGLFSTSDDMVKLSKGLISGLVLYPSLVEEMAKNRTSNYYVYSPSRNYVSTYGFLCNSKNPDKIFTDVHHGLSGRSFSQSGYPGTYIEVDPLNKINLSFLTNRTHNRLVSISPNNEYRIRRNSSGVKVLPIGDLEIIDSRLYGYDRRAITDACIELALQEKMLEELLGRDVEKLKEDVKVKILK